MITLVKDQQILDTDIKVVEGGTYNEEDNVLCINDEGQESYLQAYYIENGVVYAERV